MENIKQKQHVTRETIKTHEAGYWDAQKEAHAIIKPIRAVLDDYEGDGPSENGKPFEEAAEKIIYNKLARNILIALGYESHLTFIFCLYFGASHSGSKFYLSDWEPARQRLLKWRVEGVPPHYNELPDAPDY
ncbi:hypothetical protein [Kiloniella sp.]|uniref:hypothetical protein n=1 Tax=Kiloniella sp. TaxID=1938587 RepID=UPI003B026D5C